VPVPPRASNPMEGQSNNLSGQNQCPKPRPVHNATGRVQQTNPDDAFNLRSRIYPTHNSAAKETALTSASARLVAAEEGLVGKNQEGRPIPGGSHDLQHLNVSLEGPRHQEMCSPHPASVSYDGANPFTPRPPQLPEQPPEQFPGPGIHPFYPQQPNVGHGEHCMQYNIHTNAGWYLPRPGAYAPMPYIPQQYHPGYPPPNGRSPTLTSHLQSEHADHNALPQFHDTYYNGVRSGNDPYHSSISTPTFYPFYPPHPPLTHAGPNPHPDANENPPSGMQHPKNDSGGDKEMHAMDAA